MADGRADDHGGTTEGNETDEQFRALLEGLRTSLPGVQVLFGFLLIAPLQASFTDFDRVERIAFAVAFYSSGAASILLIAPSVHQRIRAPISGMRRQSSAHLAIATWVTIGGTVAMGIAITATILLVSHLAFAPSLATIATVVLAGSTIWAWFYLPLVTFRRLSSRGTRNETSRDR